MIEKTPVRRYQALAIASALELYARTGMRANSAYTARNMISVAGRILGQAQPKRDYVGTAKRLREWAA